MQCLLVLHFKIVSFSFKRCLCLVQSLLFLLQQLEPAGSAEGAELPRALCWGHWECTEDVVRDTSGGMSRLYQCSAPRCSEKHVKVPDQIIVHSLVGFFFFFNFFFTSDLVMIAFWPGA